MATNLANVVACCFVALKTYLPFIFQLSSSELATSLGTCQRQVGERGERPDEPATHSPL